MTPTLEVMDSVGPVFGGLCFIALMARVPGRARLTVNALLVVGASGVYLSGGFGGWELLYAFLAGPLLGWWALRSYTAIGAGWLLHAGWDALHHFWGRPIWPFLATSSWGCLFFDATIACWFFWLGARARVTAPT